MENKVSELGINLAYTQGYRDAFNKVKCPYNNPMLKKAYNKGRRDAKKF